MCAIMLVSSSPPHRSATWVGGGQFQLIWYLFCEVSMCVVCCVLCVCMCMCMCVLNVLWYVCVLFVHVYVGGGFVHVCVLCVCVFQFVALICFGVCM